MSEPVNKTIESEPETQTDPESADEGTVDGAVAPETAPEEAAPAVVTEDVDESDNESDEAGDESSDGEGDDSGDDSGSADEDGATRPGRRERLEHEGDIAADYLEELLEITDLDGDLDMDVEGDRATVSIVGANLPQLVGENGEVLEALQELTRLAVYRETGERSRLMLDVSGHRAARRTALEEEAAQIVSQVKESGEQASLEPMSPFERKVVHDVVAAAGLRSESEGAEPRRYVVVLPQ